jgi:hypothetical protein
VTERSQRSGTPDQNHVHLTAARGFHQLFAGFPFNRAGVDLAHVHCDRPSPPCNVLAQSTHLHRRRLLIVGGHSCVQPSPQRFPLSSSLAENVSGFCFAGKAVLQTF